MLLALILLFVIGYLAIALEHPLKVDKTAVALLLGMLMWIIYTIFAGEIVPVANPEEFADYLARNPALQGQPVSQQALNYVLNVNIVESLGDITQTLFFLLGAMTIVELIDVHGGFSVITDHITTRHKRKLLWVLCFTTFILSAILDNLTTTIVMLMLLRKLIDDRHERWIYAAMIVISANTGGAWSPIGDVTTIMLWVKGNVTAAALIKFVLLPSLVAMLVPLFIAQHWLVGSLEDKKVVTESTSTYVTTGEKRLIFWLGIGGLIFVPVFKSFTHLPPFIGILFVLGLLWIFTELYYNGKMLSRAKEQRLPRVISRIDMPSILFFLGILMAVAVLEHTGILTTTALFLDTDIHNVYVIDVILGVLSSIVDNVPLVAAAMGMYPVALAGTTGYLGNFVIDGVFWEFLSYCAGVGGSILIIGSAAGVIAMGLEKINFGWYLKRISWLAFLGYMCGAFVYIGEVWLLK